LIEIRGKIARKLKFLDQLKVKLKKKSQLRTILKKTQNFGDLMIKIRGEIEKKLKV